MGSWRVLWVGFVDGVNGECLLVNVVPTADDTDDPRPVTGTGGPCQRSLSLDPLVSRRPAGHTKAATRGERYGGLDVA